MELTDDAQTTFETSTNLESAYEVLRGISLGFREDYRCLKGILSLKIITVALGAA